MKEEAYRDAIQEDILILKGILAGKSLESIPERIKYLQRLTLESEGKSEHTYLFPGPLFESEA